MTTTRRINEGGNGGWDNEKWDKLESYLIEFGNLSSNNQYLYNFQLEFLSKYISSDINTIKTNMNELISQRANYSRNDFNWEKNKTKLMNEVDNIILSFKLNQFEESTVKESIEGPATANNPNNTTNHGPIPMSNNPSTTVSFVPNPTSTVANNIPKPIGKVELPKLSTTERRMSLDLMHSRPNLNSLNHKRTGSLSKPALASTSNVNVLTKADISGISDKKKPKKFDITLIIPKRHANPKIIGDINKVEIKKETRNSKNDESKNGDLKDIKRSRRISLVGENLPFYIKNQLLLHSDQRDKSATKKPSRMNNLLANSQSLYAHKDMTSLKSDSQTNNTGTSDYDHDNSGINSDSEDDKEYISPNLLTKYYDIQEENDDDIEDNDEIEFVNINDSYNSQNDDYDGNTNESEHDHYHNEDDNDYLFNV